MQIHTELDSSCNLDLALRHIKRAGRFPEVDHGDEDMQYTTLNFFTEDLSLLWRDLQNNVLNEGEIGSWIQRTSIIACEGDNGWDDYLLLHHFDPNEPLDSL